MSDLVDRIEGARSSLAFKAPCRVATTANITLSGEQTIDGVAVVEEGANDRPDRVLVKNQTDQTQNGIYSVSTGVWSRARDFDGNSDIVTGTRIYAHDGTVGAGEYIVTAADPIVIDTSNITIGSAPGSIPGATTDNAVARYNGTGGVLQDSGVTIDDSDNIAGVADFSLSGDITVGGTVDGRDVAADGTKLDGIESGATADQTAADIRTLGFFDTTNDGTGSGLDADLLDGNEASAFGDVSGPASATDGNLASFDETTGKLLKDSAINVTSGSVSGVVNLTQTGYTDLTEISEPASPAANVARARAIDDGAGVTTVGHKDSSGNVVPWSHFTQAGTGAVTRTQQAKLRESFSILDFGGVGDGSTDNAAALAAAFAALVAVGGTGGTIEFPNGQFNFSSAPTLTMPSGLFSITLRGVGADSTVLHWPTGAGLTIACSDDQHSVHVRDMTFTTGTTNAGSALTLTNSVLLGVIQQSDISGCTFRGDDGGSGTNYWSFGIDVEGLSQINFNDCMFYGSSTENGTGVSLIGDDVGEEFGIVYNFQGCTFYKTGTGLRYDGYIQGVTINQCNFVNGTTGIFQPSTAVGHTQLAITNSNFDTTGNNILLQAPVTAVSLVNCNFYIPTSGTGIAFTSTGFGCTIVGSTFNGELSSTGTTGVLVNGNVTDGICVGNSFFNLTNGIDLGGTATWDADNNVFNTVTNPILNAGTNFSGPRFTTGVGGSVTQVTSKATGVTLNRRCGQIVMHNAALASGATISFIFTNSFLTATATTIFRNSSSVGTAGAYRVQERPNGIGSTQIDITNITGGSLSQAIVLNFAVIPIVAA